MALQKITIDTSVRYVSKADSLQNEDFPKMKFCKPKTSSHPKKQKNCSQNKTELIKKQQQRDSKQLNDEY